MTPGVELLAHIREAFGRDENLATDALLERLRDRDKSPWKDVYGKPLDDRGFAEASQAYGIKSKTVRVDGDRTPKGYSFDDFYEPWKRYLPALPQVRETRATAATSLITKTMLWRTLRPLRTWKGRRARTPLVSLKDESFPRPACLPRSEGGA